MAKKPKERPYAYICLWEYETPKKKDDFRHRFWKLVECYGVDSSGYAMTKSKYATRDRYSYTGWMNREVWYGKKEGEKFYEKPEDAERSDHDWEPIMGRAVTVWQFEGGTSLADFHPPEWANWLDTRFYDEVAKLPNWFSLLADGYTLYAGTGRAVQDMIEKL